MERKTRNYGILIRVLLVLLFGLALDFAFISAAIIVADE